LKIELATNEEIEKLYAKYKKFNTHLLENPKEIFPFLGIMDVYNRVLTEQEAQDLLGYEQHNLRYGSRFLTAIIQMYHKDDELFAYFNKKAVSKAEFKFILSSLNRMEARIFRKIFATNKGIYKIGDKEALEFLVNLSIKELYFVDFFFPSLETILVGNYELCFPIYSKTKAGFEQCREIIELNELFIRE